MSIHCHLNILNLAYQTSNLKPERVIKTCATSRPLSYGGGELNMVFFPIFSFRNSSYLAFFHPFFSVFLQPFVIIVSIVTMVSLQFQSSVRAVSLQYQNSFRAVSEQFQSSFRSVSEKFQSSFRAVFYGKSLN